MNINETIASAITQREDEVAGYQFNITNYEMILERLPAEWDERSTKLNGMGYVSEEDALLLSRHKLRDDIRERLTNERIQMQTSQLVLDVLIARRDKQP